MFVNNLKVILRQLLRLRVFTVVNIAGLAVCFSCVLLLARYLQQETSYDEFHTASDRLYRTWIHEDHGDGRAFTNVSTPIILAPTLEENFPEIDHVVRIDKVNIPFRSGESFIQEDLHLVDEDFLDTFSFEWLEGNRDTALADIHNIILTPPLAEKYFGREPPLGKSLEIDTGDNVETYHVAGLIAAPPQASTLQFQALIPFSERYYGNRAESWYSVTVETYLLLRQGVEAAALEKSINSLMLRILGDSYPDEHYEVHLQPLPAIHLDTSIPAGMEPLGDPFALLLVGSAAALLLVIGSVNYTTISLGGIVRRTKEVGLRRTIGASDSNIWQHFCVEAVFVCLVSMLLGLVLAEVYLPVFNRLMASNLTLEFNGELFALMLLITMLFCLLTGSVPSLVLSRFRPANLIRNRLAFDSDKSLLMRGLVTFQFSLAIMMLASSVVVALQMRFIDSKDLGFDKHNLLVIPISDSVPENAQVVQRFMDAAGDLSFVGGISHISAPPGDGVRQLGYTDDAGAFRQFDAYTVGADFLAVLGLSLIEGRTFRMDRAFDADRALVVNEAFVREYGWEQGAGKRLPGRSFPDHEIIGVVRDANFRPLVDEVRPTVFALSFALLNQGITDVVSYSSPAPDLLIRLDGTALPQVLPILEAVWKDVAADTGFEFYMLDEALAAQYGQQANFQGIIQSVMLLAIFVSAMGLFAITLLMTNRRRKEIGIRKVMGGSVWSMVLLLTNDFSKLALLSNLIAWPVAYFAMERWLQNFAYRIDLTPLIFIGSGLIALCIAWVTVGGTAVKAANAKPVLSLRYE